MYELRGDICDPFFYDHFDTIELFLLKISKS